MNMRTFGRTFGRMLGVLVAALGAGMAMAGPLKDAEIAVNKGDIPAAIQILRPLAEQGVPKAQNDLGEVYGEVQYNQDKAREWYEKAAALGNIMAPD